jgi:hypothetical protein
VEENHEKAWFPSCSFVSFVVNEVSSLCALLYSTPLAGYWPLSPQPVRRTSLLHSMRKKPATPAGMT